MNIFILRNLFFLSVTLVCFVVILEANAQPTAQPEQGKISLVALDPDDDRNVNPDNIPSLMFNIFEEGLLRDAIIESRNPRPPPPEVTPEDIEDGPIEEKVRPPPEERYISLSGIVYESQEEWVIWLNGQRITPRAIPSEILSLHVSEESVDLKWFDDYTNKIFPIRLRPNQRFNIDMRIFLPG